MKKNVVKLALVSAALVAAPLTWGVVSAQTNPSSPAATAAKSAVNYANVFIQKLAAGLGISEDKLNAAVKTASTATIDEALKNQDITRAQADQMKLDVQNGRSPFLGGGRGFGPGGRGGPGGFGGDRGGDMGRAGPGMALRQVSLDAAAKAFGLSSADLETQLRAGKTLSDIATAKNVAIKTVQDAVLAAVKTQLAADVKAGTITQAMADDMLARLQADPNFGLFGPRGRR